MTQREKLLQRAKDNPRGLSFDELCLLAEQYGLELKQGKGSHVRYGHPNLKRPLVFQKQKDGMAAEYQVNQFLDALEDLGLIPER